jgi:hypothetical protein
VVRQEAVFSEQAVLYVVREGKTVGTPGTPATLFVSQNLSPDGKRAVVGRLDASVDLWLLDFSRNTNTRESRVQRAGLRCSRCFLLKRHGVSQTL